LQALREFRSVEVAYFQPIPFDTADKAPNDDTARFAPAWGLIARGDRASLRALLDSIGKEIAEEPECCALTGEGVRCR
jgi:hypothetical protein